MARVKGVILQGGSDKTLRLGVLASHGGSNLQAIMDACEQGWLRAQVCAVISNNSGARALERARRSGVAAYHLSGSTHPSAALLDAAICECLERHGVDLVLLAGYMRLLGKGVLERYGGRILNSHPALLPKFGGKGMYGGNVHRAVLAAGEPVTGVTIHQVDARYDHGAVVAQCEVAVAAGDTAAALEERVKRRERRFWVETLSRIASGEIAIEGPDTRCAGLAGMGRSQN